jgi:NAD(P)-dependent dehydrogenase (short-subunit alcohol dehydrogenase family)
MLVEGSASFSVWKPSRQELTRHGIQVAALHVGYMDSDMSANSDP